MVIYVTGVGVGRRGGNACQQTPTHRFFMVDLMCTEWHLWQIWYKKLEQFGDKTAPHPCTCKIRNLEIHILLHSGISHWEEWNYMFNSEYMLLFLSELLQMYNVEQTIFYIINLLLLVTYQNLTIFDRWSTPHQSKNPFVNKQVFQNHGVNFVSKHSTSPPPVPHFSDLASPHCSHSPSLENCV